MPAAKPEEFRRRAVELARLGAKPVAQIARDLGVSESGLRRWMAQSDVDEGCVAWVLVAPWLHKRASNLGSSWDGSTSTSSCSSSAVCSNRFTEMRRRFWFRQQKCRGLNTVLA